jgi:hypothetical protein
MNIEKRQIPGCKRILTTSEIPARFASIGGDTYAKDTVIELDAVVEMEAISQGGKPWLGISALVNGSVAVVGANTLMGIYFTSGEQSKRAVIDNGLNLSVKDLLGKTIKVVDHETVTVNAFRTADEIAEGKEIKEVAKNMPIFELVNESVDTEDVTVDTAKPAKKK